MHEGSTLQEALKVDNEAMIESSFRRLLAAIESEREKIRSTWVEIDVEDQNTKQELTSLRQDTEDWCYGERERIDAEWKRLDKLRDRMSVLWPEASEVLRINCSGRHFDLPKHLLVNIEGSYLNHMFSDAFVQNIPRDADGRFFLDFNPFCFGIIVEYLHKRRSHAEVPIPQVPPEHQQSMDLLAETLKLKAFLRENELMKAHGTSLVVSGNTLTAMHEGWQVIAAKLPIPMSGIYYFEVRVLENPNPKGGLAVGLSGHIPEGSEVHKIAIDNAILYNSNVGIVGNVHAVENVQKGLQFKTGSLIGVKYDARTNCVHWYLNRLPIGISQLSRDYLENMRVLYPVFGCYVPHTKLQVDFCALSPAGAPVREP